MLSQAELHPNPFLLFTLVHTLENTAAWDPCHPPPFMLRRQPAPGRQLPASVPLDHSLVCLPFPGARPPLAEGTPSPKAYKPQCYLQKKREKEPSFFLLFLNLVHFWNQPLVSKTQQAFNRYYDMNKSTM